MKTDEEALKVSRTYVETSTFLLEEIDEMIQEGFYHDRTEAVNEALRMLIKQYKVSKLHAKDLRYSSGHESKKGGESRKEGGSS
ncbi:MAG: ribbon-helix-helix domain-containing protein [Spirochaetia bacterium]|nr:hypothetical protein [Spirochaetales bacterium]